MSDTLAVFKFFCAEQLSFKAGQYATLGLEADGEFHERPYSIVSAPCERVLEFFVELVPHGLFTPRLWELKSGSTILIRRRIVGHLTLDPTVNRHLMLATVTGIAPFVSIARSLHANRKRGTDLADEFLIIHGASRVADFGPYRHELEELSRNGWLNYVPTVSRPWTERDWRGETGRVEDVMRKYADRLGFSHARAVAYACGHPQMIANAKGILARASFTREQMKEEEYFAAQRRGATHPLPGDKSVFSEYSLR